MIKKDHKKSTSVIPRLDFSKVHEKYNSETMKKINYRLHYKQEAVIEYKEQEKKIVFYQSDLI